MIDFEIMTAGDDGWSEWIHPLPGYLMKCCDCGLVHEMETAIVKAHEYATPTAEGEDEHHIIIFRMRRAEDQVADEIVAKWKALAETLAGALERIALGVSIELDDEDGPVEVWMDEEEMSEIARQALTSYKEQRDAISN